MNQIYWPGWHRSADWPRVDPPGHVFLGRAFNMIGAALFADWHNGVPALADQPAPERIPLAADAFPSDDETKPNGELRWGPYRHYAPRIARMLGKSFERLPLVTVAEWDLAAEANNEESLRIAWARQRRMMVAAECAELGQVPLPS